ncbi:MAG: nicotinate (nicotinamide) nucleotide adenylyltransferase [Anaerolineales bacterium]|uniref:Probable nicotinate-nucleotide adenylyltransferase n=1 Tax=Candidatus Desulfolinea nitratireducens TaxID=2841698 RepID=A0A8J6NNT5_9CHLR|nr:nicotinate (nicotinamide) nucleotide adenylyltransferase [Candidatus Desulfolinea nitratireducens]MBL6959822.1 nicotinate (nicotinamide) nucleotide adenylyltransferase [Anaerolineales bacterium]
MHDFIVQHFPVAQAGKAGIFALFSYVEAAQKGYTSPMQKPRLGIFGGTFDPPHLGHLILASEIRSQLKLDRLLWVLTAIPPHKLGRTITPLEHRLAMVNLAIDDNPHFELSRIEIDREGPHYAIDTLDLLKEENPDTDLIYVMGGDSLHDLLSWHRPADIVAASHEIGVMRRPGDFVDLSKLDMAIPNLRSKLRYVDAPLLEIASSGIRLRAAKGLPIQYYLPIPVYDYIQEYGLYDFKPLG